MHPDETKIIEILEQYAKGQTALTIYRYIPDFTQKLIEKGFGVEYLAETDKPDELKLNKDVATWDLNLEKFIELSIKTKTKYDVIFLAPSETNQEFVINHKEIIRSLQNHILNTGGLMLLLTRYPDFVLDRYIRPGADRITKLSLPEEIYKADGPKPHQLYAFYG